MYWQTYVYMLLFNYKWGDGLMKTYKAYKFRLYPSEKQTILIHKTFGCVR